MRRAIACACALVLTQRALARAWVLTKRALARTWAGCCVALALAACGDIKQAGPAKTCAKAYEQCVLPSGVLGVCNTVDCAPGQPEPCLICRSQH